MEIRGERKIKKKKKNRSMYAELGGKKIVRNK